MGSAGPDRPRALDAREQRARQASDQGLPLEGERPRRRAWDADSYDRVSAAMDPAAEAVLGRLRLNGDETVLDAGCGTGRITARLLELVPRGRVIAVDMDPQMVDLARERLPADTRVIQADLLELSLPETVDAIFSTATFHWILDQDRLFAKLASLLRPGGRLVAQCGGVGTMRRVIDAATAVAAEPSWRERFVAFAPNWFLVTPQEPLDYLKTIPLGSWLQMLSPAERQAFAERVAAGLGRPLVIENVRLNIDAVRGGEVT